MPRSSSPLVLILIISIICLLIMQIKQADHNFKKMQNIDESLVSIKTSQEELTKKLDTLQIPRAIAFTPKSQIKDTLKSPIPRHKDEVSGDWLITTITSDPNTLNPLTENDGTVNNIWRMLNDSLAMRNPKKPDEWIPRIAYKWEQSPDNMEYIFYLRENIKWHDGVSLTAHDVKFAYDAIMNDGVLAMHSRSYLKDVKSCETIDDYTVKFTMARPYFLSFTTLASFSPIPRHYYAFDKLNGKTFNEHKNNRIPLGCGAWKFKEWIPSKKIILERNENYYADKPNFLKRVLKIVPDQTVQLQMLLAKNIDTISLTKDQYVNETDSKHFKSVAKKYERWGQFYKYIGWNNARPLFSDKRVRRALTMLVDRETIIKRVHQGLGKITTGNFWIFSPDYDKSIQPLPYSPERAKELLAEAGWVDTNKDGILDKDGTNFEFTFLLINGMKEYEKEARIYQESFRTVGIVMNISPIDWSSLLERIKERNFDAISLGWGMGWEGDPYQIWHSSQVEGEGSNAIGFKNKAVDRLIENARKEFDIAKRRAMFNKIHAILHDEQPYTFLFTPKSTGAYNNRIENVNFHTLGAYSPEWFVPKAKQTH